jgi:hypothetical protein
VLSVETPGSGTGGAISDLSIYHLDTEGASAGYWGLEIVGNTAGNNSVNTTNNINLYGYYCEVDAGDGCLSIKDSTTVHAFGTHCQQGAGSGGDCVKIAQTGANRTGNVTVDGLFKATGITNAVNNTITGTALTSILYNYYRYGSGTAEAEEYFDATNNLRVGPLTLPSVAFADLGTPANGTIKYCSDCNSTCTAGSSTGRTCFRENGAWTH